jgi:hypothetical protein
LRDADEQLLQKVVGFGWVAIEMVEVVHGRLDMQRLHAAQPDAKVFHPARRLREQPERKGAAKVFVDQNPIQKNCIFRAGRRAERSCEENEGICMRC